MTSPARCSTTVSPFRECHRAAGLDHHLEVAERQGHCARHLGIADREAAGETAPVEREGQLARHRR
jgi:hypothetical protein